VPLIVGSERVGDVSGASIADLGPGSALLEDEGGEPPGTPFARVRPHTSYCARRGEYHGYKLPTAGQHDYRGTHMDSESVRRRHLSL
jgi:hypothetical protein